MVGGADPPSPIKDRVERPIILHRTSMLFTLFIPDVHSHLNFIQKRRMSFKAQIMKKMLNSFNFVLALKNFFKLFTS